jgi:NAD(P)H-hydrate epimerase
VSIAEPLSGDWTLVSAAQMRALDRHSIDALGIPGELLMESAGRAVAAAVLRDPRARAGVQVVCGTGNNGGDGFVAARHLAQQGLPVRLQRIGDAARVQGDARRHLERALAIGLTLEVFREPESGIAIDAIFGTGLSRAVEGEAKSAIEVLCRARAARGGALAIVAADLPSGICSDTGRVLGAAVFADRTVSFELPKLGLTLEPGRAHAGEIEIARIGIAQRAPGVEFDARLWTPVSAGQRLPERPASGHKGSFGHALLAAGSEGKGGAAALAGIAAGRAGAGLVTIACPAAIGAAIAAQCSEAMSEPIGGNGARAFAARDIEAVLALAATRSALGLGPGLGRDPDTSAFAREVALRARVPLALDADGLFAFGGQLEALRERRASTLLTPHPGEAGLLLGCSAAEINADRVGAARELAKRSGAIAVLKGAGTVTADPSGAVVVNPTGGPALGTGGTGDVLLGICTGLLAQGLDASRAGALAAYLHGLAGDRIAARQGDSGLLAGDLLSEIPHATRALREAASLRKEISFARRFP